MEVNQSPGFKATLSFAREYSISRKFYFIDIDLITLAIFITGDMACSMMNAIEKAYIVSKLEHQLNKHPERTHNASTVPLTLAAERLINFAIQYQDADGQAELENYHFILAALSSSNSIHTTFKEQGWVFENYKNALNKLFDLPVTSTKLVLNYETTVIKPFSSFYLFFLSKKNREKIIENLIKEALVLYEYHKYADCRKACQNIFRLDPQNRKARSYMAYSFVKERKFKEAIAEYESIKEKNSAIFINLALCYRELGNPDKAISILNSIPEKTMLLLNNLGFVLIDKNQFRQAISYFDLAIDKNENYAFPLNNKGYCLFKIGDIGAAKRLIYQSLELNKGNSFAWKNLALIHIAEGNKVVAKEAIDKAILYDYREDYGDDIDEIIRLTEAM